MYGEVSVRMTKPNPALPGSSSKVPRNASCACAALAIAHRAEPSDSACIERCMTGSSTRDCANVGEATLQPRERIATAAAMCGPTKPVRRNDTSRVYQLEVVAKPVALPAIVRIDFALGSQEVAESRMGCFDLRARRPAVISEVIAAAEPERIVDQCTPVWRRRCLLHRGARAG